MATQNTAMDNAALIKEVNEAHKHKKYSVGYHAQTVVAVIVTLDHALPAVLDDRNVVQVRRGSAAGHPHALPA